MIVWFCIPTRNVLWRDTMVLSLCYTASTTYLVLTNDMKSHYQLAFIFGIHVYLYGERKVGKYKIGSVIECSQNLYIFIVNQFGLVI